VIAARWDARAESWDRWVGDPDCYLNEDDSYARFMRQARSEIERRRKFCRTHGIIDMGCGTGLVLAEVVAAFAWGIGVDISSEMIRLANAKAIYNTSFQVGDCFRLAEICPPAGVVLSRGVLLSHYGTEAGARLLKAAFDALVPGGFFIFDFLNEAGRSRTSHLPEGKSFFRAQEIRTLARGAGFCSVAVAGRRQWRVLIATAQRLDRGYGLVTGMSQET